MGWSSIGRPGLGPGIHTRQDHVKIRGADIKAASSYPAPGAAGWFGRPVADATVTPALHAVVVVGEYDAPAQRALQYAAALRPSSLVALNVCTDRAQTARLIQQWARHRLDTPLQSVLAADEHHDPVLDHVERVCREHPADLVAVVLPIVATSHWWQRALHRPPDPSLPRRLAPLSRVMVTEVPWQLPAWAGGPGLQGPNGPPA